MTPPDWLFKMTTREWRRFNVYYDELKGCLFANGVISGLPKEGLEVIDLAAYEELQHKFYDCDRARSKLFIVFDEIQKERDALKAEVEKLRTNLVHMTKKFERSSIIVGEYSLTCDKHREENERLKQVERDLQHEMRMQSGCVRARQEEIEELREENERLKSDYQLKDKMHYGLSVEFAGLEEKLRLRERRLERAKQTLEIHTERHCPKSLNQSSCTWMHDYDEIKKTLKDIEEMGK